MSAACYEHAPVIGCSAARMAEWEDNILSLCADMCSDTFAWCVLPNHYHLLVQTQSIRPFRRSLGSLHGRISRQWNQEEDRTGRQVWHNCFERPIKSERHYYAALNYVHHNPVKDGYVEKWIDWPFSSACDFVARLGRDAVERMWEEYPILDFGKGWDDRDWVAR